MTTFYYTIPTLINRVNLEVLYKARKEPNVLGFGENTILDAEMLVREYLSSIAHELFDKHLSKFGRNIETNYAVPPFEWSVSFTAGETTLEDCVVFRAEFPEKFAPSTIPAVQRSIEDCIVSYAVWQWLMDSQIGIWQKYEAEYNKKEENLIGLLNRRIGLTRSYKLY